MRTLGAVRSVILGTAALAMGLTALPAVASVVPLSTTTFTLNAGNSALNGYAGPYGTVTVDLTSSTTANLTYTGGSSGQYTYLFSDSDMADANVNASSWTIGSFTATNLSGFSSEPAGYPLNTGSRTVDGFGTFNQTTKGFDGYKYAASSVGFTLTNTSGTWADAAGVLTPNTRGYSVAAHIFVCNTSAGACSPSIGAAATGYASVTPVPLPAAGWLFGSGLLGLVGFLVRRGRKA